MPRRLSDDQKQKIRDLHNLDGWNFTASELARGFKVSVATVRRIIRGPKPPPNDAPLTVSEVAGLLNVSDRHVYDLVKEGKIACQRHGRAIRVTRDQFAEYLREAERGPVKTNGFRHL